MSRVRERISLHVDELFLLWFAHHKLKDLPPYLGVNPVGRTRTERAGRTAAASETLAQRNLGTIEDPAADLREIVDLLAEAPVRLEFGLTAPEAETWTVAAVRDSRAVLATRTNMEILLSTCESSGMVESLIRKIPPMEPGKGTSANIRVDDFERAREAEAAKGTLAFRKVLRDVGVHESAAPTLSRAVEGSVGGGMLAAMRRDDTGTWRHATLDMSWLDTATGRYAIRHDDTWVTVVPADTGRLSSMAHHVLERVELV